MHPVVRMLCACTWFRSPPVSAMQNAILSTSPPPYHFNPSPDQQRNTHCILLCAHRPTVPTHPHKSFLPAQHLPQPATRIASRCALVVYFYVSPQSSSLRNTYQTQLPPTVPTQLLHEFLLPRQSLPYLTRNAARNAFRCAHVWESGSMLDGLFNDSRNFISVSSALPRPSAWRKLCCGVPRPINQGILPGVPPGDSPRGLPGDSKEEPWEDPQVAPSGLPRGHPTRQYSIGS